MNLIIKKIFSITLIILLFSFPYSGDANDTKGGKIDKDEDATTKVICNIIGYVWSIGGPLMTVVIIGASMLAIFGRMPWPALFALGIFCAVFFGAPAIVKALMKNINAGENNKIMETCGVTQKSGDA